MDMYPGAQPMSERMAGNADATTTTTTTTDEDVFDVTAHEQQQEQKTATTQHHHPHIHRPIPRRNFSATFYSSVLDSDGGPFPFPHSPPSTLPSLNTRSSDFLAQLNARLLRTNNAGMGNGWDDAPDSGGPPTRNKSLLNMTSSTLFGIYDEAGVGTSTAADTPWGVGAETPAVVNGVLGAGYDGAALEDEDGGMGMRWGKRGSVVGTLRDQNAGQRPSSRRGHEARAQKRAGFRRFASLFGKMVSLFLFGAVYGIIVSHLHDTRELAAVQVGGMDHKSWTYSAGWGVAGLVLGCLLPYVDFLSGGDAAVVDDAAQRRRQPGKETESSLWEQCNEVVRSVGAFVGIAFAIRRLPWQSTLQLTLTLALVNPALWYILDRTKNGLSVSLITTSILTSLIFLSNPDVLPSPALPATINATFAPSQRYSNGDELFAGVVSYESLATATWVGSVVFCSCICFGGIGRRLAVLEGAGKR